MIRVPLPDLVVPTSWVDTGKIPIQVELYVRDRRRWSNTGTRSTLAVTVDAASIEEAYAKALPILIGRVNRKITGQMVWAAGEPLPGDKEQQLLPQIPKGRKKRSAGHSEPWLEIWSPWDDIGED